MNANTNRNKIEQIHFRADEDFCNKLDLFINSNKLKKSSFIREAILEKMSKYINTNYESLLSDNKFYNYVLQESTTNRTCKTLLEDFERRMSSWKTV